MLDARLHVANRVGQTHRVVRLLLEKMKRDAVGRGHADAGKTRQFVHQVLNALRVRSHGRRNYRRQAGRMWVRVTISRPMDFYSMMRQATQLHEAGRLAEAETLYRQILSANPGHLDALHMLGVIAYQVGRNDAAVDLIGRVVARSPCDAEAQNNLAAALFEL